jgi:tRNA uridine 5-carboxymethylaminomethyl modification enzyme
MEGHKLPDGIDYSKIRHLSNEARTKLTKFRPATLGQASRIAGVTPADITVLMIHLKTNPATKTFTPLEAQS